MMENIMFWSMFSACLMIIAMTMFALHLQAKVNNDLRRKYNDLRRELIKSFGWEDYEWSNNFRDYAREVETLIKFKKRLNSLISSRKRLMHKICRI
jgi:hypothetical protein|nr:MAG TPA: hypothetical protein [Caudoviricetes sp.]